MGSMNFKKGWFFWVVIILITLIWLGNFEGEFIPAIIFTVITVGILYLIFIILAKFFG